MHQLLKSYVEKRVHELGLPMEALPLFDWFLGLYYDESLPSSTFPSKNLIETSGTAVISSFMKESGLLGRDYKNANL